MLRAYLCIHLTKHELLCVFLEAMATKSHQMQRKIKEKSKQQKTCTLNSINCYQKTAAPKPDSSFYSLTVKRYFIALTIAKDQHDNRIGYCCTRLMMLPSQLEL